MSQAPQYWLMKSEPDVYSIDDLKRDTTTYWEGVRNYQARNFMRDQMNIGDQVLFYHSNATPPGVAGIAKISKTGYADFTAWDPKAKYFDPKTDSDNPRWYMVDIQFVEKFSELVTLETIKADPKLTEMLVVKRGMRLSIQPVEKKHFERVVKLGRKS